MTDTSSTDLLTLTADIVAAYVSGNPLKPEDLPGLILGTHASLTSAAAPVPVAAAGLPELDFRRAVSVRRSLADPNVILSMIDGKPYKVLRRHLSARGLTPAEYRARYKLPADYPTVAPAYSEARRETAKRLGLGGKRKNVRAAASGQSTRGRAPGATVTRGRKRSAS